MWDYVQEDYSFDNVDVLKLDGVSAAQNFSVTAQGSLVAGDSIPQSAGVLSFRTTQRGSRGRGRIFLGPIAEDNQAQGIVNNTIRNTVLADWQAFQAALIAASPACDLVVASYVHADAHLVTTIKADQVVGTIKARVDQLR